MGRRRRHVLLSACLAAGALACPAAAKASSDQESIFQDDPKIVFDSPETLDRTMARVRALGADRVRVSVFWNLIAPRPHGRKPPSWGRGQGADPASYPIESWRRYDRVVKAAAKHGLSLLFTITGPAPTWASHGRGPKAGAFRPDPARFRDFVAAVGKRYSGTYPEARGSPDALPGVDAWSVWNEPNFPSWLSPQRVKMRPHPIPTSPRIYRNLAEAAYAGLHQSGHGSDTILLGETAPRGDFPTDTHLNKTMIPLAFIRELYCLKRNYQPYHGRPARLRGCPTNGASRGSFVTRHPALFQASGWAHHPYSLKHLPTWTHPVGTDAIPLGALPRMTHAFDRVFFRWGVDRQLPIYITEYGYQTKPPDRYGGVSWDHQAAWSSWAESIAYRNQRVASFAQFLLVDDLPLKKGKGARRWITWQSGLYAYTGKKKPFYDEYQRPVYVTPTRVARNGNVQVFGCYRPADEGAQIQARIELRPNGGDWRPLRGVAVTNPHGYLFESVTIPESGELRIVWTDPGTGQEVPSRSVEVTVRG